MITKNMKPCSVSGEFFPQIPYDVVNQEEQLKLYHNILIESTHLNHVYCPHTKKITVINYGCNCH